MIVLGVLLGAMTLASGLLLVLEPGPVAPATIISASATDSPRSFVQQLTEFNPGVESRDWQAITIRFSGARNGSYDSINTQHHRVGLGGAAHHFVIGNGFGDEDGRTAWGFRWRNQLETPYAANAQGLVDVSTIDICLIGDGRTPPTQQQMDELVRLLHGLQRTFTISADRIHLAYSDGHEPVAFPKARLWQQLLKVVR